MNFKFILPFSVLLAGCQITKDIEYSSLQTNSASCQIPVSSLEINSPKKGENVFKFEDIVNANVASGGSFISMSNVKRADFNYILTQDSAPDLKNQLIDIYPETGKEKAQSDIKFNYYLTSSSTMENEVVLVINASFDFAGSTKSYQSSTKGKYSTFPVTYPDQEFLNKISSRYGLKDWMICYIQNEYGIFISEFLCLSPVSGFKKISLNSMVDLLADELSKDFQLNIDPNTRSELKMSVSGVEEYKHLLSVEKIIESNVLVDSYSINSISNHTVTYLLSIRGQVSDLEKLMNVNPLLLGQPIKKGEADLEYSFKVGK